MDDFETHEVTPRPLPVVNHHPIRAVDPVEALDHTPYIPRRKSSVNDRHPSRADSPLSDNSIRSTANSTFGQSTSYAPNFACSRASFGGRAEDVVQRARFPIDGYDQVVGWIKHNFGIDDY